MNLQTINNTIHFKVIDYIISGPSTYFPEPEVELSEKMYLVIFK